MKQCSYKERDKMHDRAKPLKVDGPEAKKADGDFKDMKETLDRPAKVKKGKKSIHEY